MRKIKLKMKLLATIVACFAVIAPMSAQDYGCADPDALNYDSTVTSGVTNLCIYPDLKIKWISQTSFGAGEAFFILQLRANVAYKMVLVDDLGSVLNEHEFPSSSFELWELTGVIPPNSSTETRELTLEFRNLNDVVLASEILTQAGAIYGCMDSTALNYNPLATIDDGLCEYTQEPQYVSIGLQTIGNGEIYLSGKNTSSVLAVVGDTITLNAVPDNGWKFVKWLRDSLTVSTNSDYSFEVTINSGGTIIAQFEQEFIPVPGCTDPYSLNYNPQANVDNGTCTYKTIEEPIEGCTNSKALNYNPVATTDDDSCIMPEDVIVTPQPIYGCNDIKALNFNPNATDYDPTREDCQCVYANEENIYVPEIIEELVDTAGTKPIENCALRINVAITDVSISQVEVLDPHTVKVHWVIKLEGGITILYETDYAVNQSGVTLFYLSIICKEGAQQARSLSLRAGGQETSVTGFTVSATYDVDLGPASICQPSATGNIAVYPNPTTGIVNISEEAAIKVYSLRGALLQETVGTQVNLSAYPQGIYHLQVNGIMVKVIKK